jgi:xylulokinase
MAADVFDLPVAVTEQTEGAAFGAALQALWALDHASGGKTEIAALAREHVRCADTLGARPTRADAYREPYQRFLRHMQSAQQFYANH